MHFALLLALTLLPAASPENGTQLEFKGRFVAEKGDPVITQKDFTLSCLIDHSEKGAVVYWTLHEQGRGKWSWLDQFGKLTVDAKWRCNPAELPTLRYERPSGTSIVPILPPLFATDQAVTRDADWTQDRLRFQVTGDTRVADLPGWKIDVRNAYGRQRTFVLDKESPLVLAATSTVFIGQGEEHELSYELVKRERLNEPELAAARRGFTAMLKLREQLDHEPRTREFQWNPARLTTLREQLPAAADQVAREPLLAVAQLAKEDARRQANRSGALSAVRKQLVGKPAPRPELKNIDGTDFDWKRTDGRVTVLHFWSYRDSPLEEPYGQVAYVDFLYRQRKEQRVAVLGIAVNELLDDPETFAAGGRSAKKLKSFMNLSYPVLLDDGEAIRAFGDPRATGAKLPLVVVIDAAGKVVHYHVGLYQFDRDRGLAELDDAVTQAAKTGE